MGVISYLTVDGQIEGEEQNGVRTDYLTDPLGSVTATVNSSCAVMDQYWYKPYGNLLAKFGVGEDPRFIWVGCWGYGLESEHLSMYYIRGRHFYSSSCAWTSRDLYWPLLPQYNYCASNPTRYVDPLGLFWWVFSSSAVEFTPKPQLPPGWSVEVGGQGSGAFPRPYPIYPNPDIYPGQDALIDQDEWDWNQCNKLAWEYHRVCAGPLPNNPTYNKCDPCDSEAMLVAKTDAHCQCCRLRSAHLDRCSHFFQSGLEGHIKAADAACKRCNECIALENQGERPYIGPVPLPRPLPDIPWEIHPGLVMLA